MRIPTPRSPHDITGVARVARIASFGSSVTVGAPMRPRPRTASAQHQRQPHRTRWRGRESLREPPRPPSLGPRPATSGPRRRAPWGGARAEAETGRVAAPGVRGGSRRSAGRGKQTGRRRPRRDCELGLRVAQGVIRAGVKFPPRWQGESAAGPAPARSARQLGEETPTLRGRGFPRLLL